MKPYLGQIVQYLSTQVDEGGNREVMPAVITRVWNGETGCCNLLVLGNGVTQNFPSAMTSILYSPHGEDKPGCWREIEEPQSCETLGEGRRDAEEFVSVELISQPQPVQIHFSPVFHLSGSEIPEKVIQSVMEMYESVLEAVRGK